MRYPFPMLRRLLLLAPLVTSLPLGPGLASAQIPSDEVPLEDVLELLVLDRNLIAVDARQGGQRTLRLRLEERVLWTGSRGKVGVVLTDQRILAVASGSGAWQQESRELNETLPARAILGDRVALVLTSNRALGFDGGSGNLVESRLGIREKVLANSIGANVAVIVTDRRSLGLSPLVGGFFPVKMNLVEKLESVTAGANLATVTTDRRVLIFRAPSGSWEERNRSLRP